MCQEGEGEWYLFYFKKASKGEGFTESIGWLPKTITQRNHTNLHELSLESRSDIGKIL